MVRYDTLTTPGFSGLDLGLCLMLEEEHYKASGVVEASVI